jgi:hypothetical protein
MLDSSMPCLRVQYGAQHAVPKSSVRHAKCCWISLIDFLAGSMADGIPQHLIHDENNSMYLMLKFIYSKG